MNVSFGNLVQPRHSDGERESQKKVSEMMEKLHKAGFKQVENTSKIDDEPKSYHVFDLPHKIVFSSHGSEAISIMQPYSKYMKPLSVVAPKEALQ